MWKNFLTADEQQKHIFHTIDIKIELKKKILSINEEVSLVEIFAALKCFFSSHTSIENIFLVYQKDNLIIKEKIFLTDIMNLKFIEFMKWWTDHQSLNMGINSGETEESKIYKIELRMNSVDHLVPSQKGIKWIMKRLTH